MPAYFDTNEVVAHLRDGRVIAKSTYAQVLSSGTNNIVVRVPDLKYIQTVLEIEFYSDPDTYYTCVMDKKITGNVVGFTLYGLNASTTLTTEVVAVGPP